MIVVKTCVSCLEKFESRSGSRKFCPGCYNPPCLQCGKRTTGPRNKFCNNVCSGLWQHKNLPHVRASLEDNWGAPKSKKTRKSISLSLRGRPRYDMRGENNINWKDGKQAWSVDDKTIGEWKRLVLARDNFTCQSCGKRSKSNHAHHIKEKRFYPDLRTDISNGLTLCASCHHSHHMTKDNPRRKLGISL